MVQYPKFILGIDHALGFVVDTVLGISKYSGLSAAAAQASKAASYGASVPATAVFAAGGGGSKLNLSMLLKRDDH